MSITELKKIIQKSSNEDWFYKTVYTINIPYLKYKKELVWISSIYKFLNREVKWWENIIKKNEEEWIILQWIFSDSYNKFKNIRNRIELFIKNYSWMDEDSLNSYWRQEINQLNNLSSTFIHDSAITNFLIDTNIHNWEHFQWALNYVKWNISLNNQNDFIGNLLAHDFVFRENKVIKNRAKIERKSINDIKKALTDWINSSEEELNNHIKTLNDLYELQCENFEELKKAKETKFNNWYDNIEKNFWVFDESSKKKIIDLEQTYESLLKLNKPADYWEKRWKKLREEWEKSLKLLIVFTLLSVVLIFITIAILPNWIANSFNESPIVAIKWSIAFITFISFLAYWIRTLNKITFSAFHLSRDAEERKQLTNVYLSLSKEWKIDIEERKLILQSLFSRVETWLLKDDSSPTMPNDFISKFIWK